MAKNSKEAALESLRKLAARLEEIRKRRQAAWAEEKVLRVPVVRVVGGSTIYTSDSTSFEA